MKTTSSQIRILVGFLLLIAGASFLLQELGLLNFSLGNLISTWWPIAVIAVGIVVLFNNPHSFLFPLLVIFAGILLQFRQLDILTFNIWNLIWPAAIVAFGLSLMFERSNKQARKLKNSKHTDDPNAPKINNDDTVSVLAIFSGAEVKNTSDHFQGGNASSAFGAFEIDLRDATLKEAATLDVFTMFGGGEIIVPEGWRIETNGLPIFGGWENKTRKPKDKNAPTLLIRGTCLFGGVSIVHKRSSSSSW